MATDAQSNANRANAQLSTGPRSAEGKRNSSQNATTHGLFSQRELDKATPTPEYRELQRAIYKELSPNGIIQNTYAEQIARATSRLRHCDAVEDYLHNEIEKSEIDGSQLSPELQKLQLSIDRARSQYQRLLNRAIAELRKLQTADAYVETIGAPAQLNLIDHEQITKTIHRTEKSRKRFQHEQAQNEIEDARQAYAEKSPRHLPQSDMPVAANVQPGTVQPGPVQPGPVQPGTVQPAFANRDIIEISPISPKHP